MEGGSDYAETQRSTQICICIPVIGLPRIQASHAERPKPTSVSGVLRLCGFIAIAEAAKVNSSGR